MIGSDTKQCALSCRLEMLPGARIIDRLNSAKRFGFDAVALPGRFLNDYLEELRACLSDLPLPLATLSLGFTGTLVSPRPAVRAQCRASLLRVFDLCAELGVWGFNMPPVLIQDNPERITQGGADDSAVETRNALLLEQLPQLGDEAGQRGVYLLLEPVNRYESDYLNTVADGTRICEALDHPSIGLTADFFHMQMEELDIAQALEKGAKWIAHIHVAENTRVEPGPGAMNFTPGFHALKAMGYGGIIEVECRTLSGPAEVVLPRSAKYLRAIWARA
ncbi:MAG: sugar phosphate isomerase/epimerase [bacterium]|nr:sugar phosphate isomerase/epimerase [bacterium]